MAFNFLKNLDSDDIFISYSRDDGEAYLKGLDAALSARGFSCFTDRRGTDADPLPPKTLFRKIRLCKTLVLLATPGALQHPENIAPEVSAFAEANGTSRIICVSFDRGADFTDWSKTPWYTHVEGKAREREEAETLKTGAPSPTVVETIAAASDYMKSKDRLRKYRNSALVVLAGLVVAIIVAAVIAGMMFKRAAAATAKADAETAKAAQATRDAQDAVTQARTAQAEAQTARDEAKIAKDDAIEQKRLAGEATRDATEKAKLAAESARLAKAAEAARIAEQAKAIQARREAERQQEVALTRRLANQSALTLQQSPELLPRSVSLAVEAEKRSIDLGLRSLEADKALRDSLGLLPKSLGSKDLLGNITSATFSPDAEHIATVSPVSESDDSGKVLTIRRTADGGEVTKVACPCGVYALSRDGRRVALSIETSETKVVRVKEVNSNLYWDVPVKLPDDSVTRVALSPNGKYLIMSLKSEEYESAELWNVESAKLISRLKTNGYIGINAMAFSPGGKFFAISGVGFGARGRGVSRTRVWDLSSATDAENLTAADLNDPEEFLQDGEVSDVAISDDGRYLATTVGQTALVWRKTNQGGFQQVGRMPLKRNIEGLAFHTDGKRISTLSIVGEKAEDEPAPRVLDTWEIKGYWESFSTSHSGEIANLAFSPDDEFVTTVSDNYRDDKVQVWKVEDGSEVKSANLLPQDVKEDPQNVTPDIRYIVTAKSEVVFGVTEGRYSVWDVQARKTISLPPEPDFIDLSPPALRPDGQLMGRVGKKRGEENRSVLIYKLAGDAYVRNTYWRIKTGNAELSLSPSGGYLIAKEAIGRPLSVLRVSDGKDITPTQIKEFKGVDSFQISPTGNLLAIKAQEINQPQKLLVWDVARGQEIKVQNSIANIKNFVFSPSDSYLAISGEDQSVQVFDVKQGKMLLKDTSITAGFDLPANDAERITAFSKDERYIATGSDAMIKVFEIATGEEIAHLPHYGIVTNIVFSKDGKRLAVTTKPLNDDVAVEGEANVLHVWLLNPTDLIREACQRLERFSPGENYPSHCRGS